jgi:hypothetical protein
MATVADDNDDDVRHARRSRAILSPGPIIACAVSNRRVVSVRTFHVFALAGVLLTVAVPPARAEGFFAPFVGYDFGGDSKCPTINGCQDKHSDFGVSF